MSSINSFTRLSQERKESYHLIKDSSASAAIGEAQGHPDGVQSEDSKQLRISPYSQ